MIHPVVIGHGTSLFSALRRPLRLELVDAAVHDAKHAAGDKNVLVHGAGIAQRALTAGLLDELEIHLVPVLLGEGRRLFEHLGVEQRELERIRVLEGEGGVTHLCYSVGR